MKKYLLAILVIILLSAGVVVGLILVKNNQLFNQKASTPTGTATISISPATANFDRGVANPVTVSFNTGGVLVKTFQAVINYSNVGVQASNIQLNPDLAAQGWSIVYKNISTTGSTDAIQLSATVGQAGPGYSNTTDTPIFTFDVTATQVPSINPVEFSFDPDATLTVLIQASDGSDISMTPNTSGLYTITDTIAQSPTPTPIIVVTNPTPTPVDTQAPSSTSTPVPTSTTTATVTTTPVPTATTIALASGTASPAATAAALPVTGFDTPTIVGGATGILLLIFGAAALIL